MFDPMPDPRNDSSIHEYIRMARRLWVACLFFPFGYVIIAWLLEVTVFDGYGFWPISDDRKYMKVVLGFVAAAVCMQFVLMFVRHHYTRKMHDFRLRPRYMAHALWQRTMYGIMCGDTVSGLGLVLFLFNGDWNYLIYFCLGSYIIYAQISPQLPANANIEEERLKKEE
jgi:hypothetical protein